MKNQEKNQVLDRLQRKGLIDCNDLKELRSELNEGLDDVIAQKKRSINDLFVDVTISKLGISI